MKIILAERKKTQYVISITFDSDRVVRFAAKELSSYLEKMSDAEFSVSENAKGRTIELVSGGNAKMDSFEIQVSDDGIKIHGANSRSVLYGVYDFLEKIGCNFVEPGKEIVPKSSRLIVDSMKCKSTAAFALRNIFRIQIMPSKTEKYEGLEPSLHLPQIDWMAKRKLNHYVFYVDYYRYDLWENYKHQILDALMDRGFDIEVTHHSIHYFCPPDATLDFGNYGPETYRSTHPEWYVGEQTRIELSAVQSVIRKRYIEYLRRNPELCKIGLWPADTSMNISYKGLSSTDGYIKFWNNMAKPLAAEFPEKQLSILAYWELLNPPQKVTPASNLHCWFCPIDANYMYPITDRNLSRNTFRTTKEVEPNSKYLDFMKTWVDRMSPGQVSCFEYYGWQGTLTPLVEKMKKDLTVYRDMKVGGIYGWSGFTFNLMGADFRWARDLYVFSNLLWNPEQGIAPLEFTWAKGVFDNAAEDILDFYHKLKLEHEKEIKNGLLTRASWISLDLLHRLQKSLASARRKESAPAVIQRIDILERVACQGCTERVLRKASEWDKFL